MKEKVLEVYDKLAKDYEKHVDTQSGHNAYYERPAMMKHIPTELAGKSVLDAGCAAGWYSEQFLKRGAQVAAMDISPEMVEACKRRLGNEAAVLTCDLTQPLPYEDESFDWIISSLTLHYIEEWKPTFREFHRILKPGGHLIFSVHHPFMDFKLFDRPDYFALELLTDKWTKQEAGPVEVTFYRRPMQEIINDTALYFRIDQMIEPQPSDEYRSCPEALEWYKKWDKYLMTNPHFLIVKAQKSS
ncbi:class I SAM-dependent methyltransferase [Paenibacillus dakarensis]|uniref:class I SAM-dependent methyltransferase n=1 Tax=Paenibacillus dakarensis TaxID=1527293 RepID=UPI0006D5631F|nr:class I SAM-dependent methyltransferase [Paenibacillus dakarensis]